MLTRSIAVIAVIATTAVATLIAPLVAGAAPTAHPLRMTINDSTITSQGDRIGNRQTTAGLVAGNPLGNGVESISDKVAKATNTTFTFKGTTTIYTTHGSVSGAITITITPQSSGGATGTGSGTITSGTGRYAGAHGHFTFTGSEGATSSVFSSHATGTISY